MKERYVAIDIVKYEHSYSCWCLEKGNTKRGYNSMSIFNSSNGLKSLVSGDMERDSSTYFFRIEDDQKYFLAKIKYAF